MKVLRGLGLGGITGSPQAFAVSLAIMALLLAIPALHNGYIELTVRNILMFAAMSYGWNLLGGYTGYVSFGNVVFFGIGAYCSAVLSAGSGRCVLPAKALKVGTYTVVAAYGGTSSYGASNSAGKKLTITA